MKNGKKMGRVRNTCQSLAFEVYIREIDEELYLAVLQAATAIRG
jgi:hypothetical protein